MPLGKQAKVVSSCEQERLLEHVSRFRHPERDRVMILLSFKAGMRAVEIAKLTWRMVTTSTGEIDDHIALPNRASKGKSGGRIIPMHPFLRVALETLRTARPDKYRPCAPVIYSERAPGLNANAIAVWFHARFKEIGVEGASSHSGRRTFITQLAKKIVDVGGSLRDVQQLAGHASLSTTQRYIEGDSEAKRRAIDLI
jgi:integrase/recombinase XerD